MLTAVLTHPARPDGASVTLSFPIGCYDEAYRMLSSLGCGDAMEQDCFIRTIDSRVSELNVLVGQCVNVDELDYLAKRLESFGQRDMPVYRGCAIAYCCESIMEPINLSFCCDGVTLVQDFNNLEQIGKTHCMTIGESALGDKSNLFYCKVAIDLLSIGSGIVTPYGVVFDNEIIIEPLYKGQEFPEYYYDDYIMHVTVQSKSLGETSPIGHLFLPMEKGQIEHTMERCGIKNYEDMVLTLKEGSLLKDLGVVAQPKGSEMHDLSDLCFWYSEMGDGDIKMLAAAAEHCKATTMCDYASVVRNYEWFAFVPDICTPEEYGRKMAPVELGGAGCFFDYDRYGEHRIRQEGGEFTKEGYLCYLGKIPIQEMLESKEPVRCSEEMEML